MGNHSAAPLLIVADNYRLATHYAWDHDLGREGVGWRYIAHSHQVRGMRPGKFVVISIGKLSPKEHAERRDVVETLRMYGWTT